MDEIGRQRLVPVGVEYTGSGELFGQLGDVDAVDAQVSERRGCASDKEYDGRGEGYCVSM